MDWLSRGEDSRRRLDPAAVTEVAFFRAILAHCSIFRRRGRYPLDLPCGLQRRKAGLP
jgi:hypothetical protein